MCLPRTTLYALRMNSRHASSLKPTTPPSFASANGRFTKFPFIASRLSASASLNFAFIQKVVKATVGTLAQLAEPIHADWETVDVNLPNVDASIANNTPQEWMAVTPNPGNE